MKKKLIVFSGVFVFALIFLFYESYKAGKEINLVWDFWRVAIEQAQRESLTTEEFYSKYNHLGEYVFDDIIPSPALVLSIRLDGNIFSKYSLRIYYYSARDGGVSSTFITGRSHGVLCLI